MFKEIKRIPDTELDIMLVLWEFNRPMKAVEILSELSKKREWQKATVQVLLSRLAERGFVETTQENNYNLFSPLITEEEYRSSESVSFIEKICRGSFSTLVTTLINANAISDKDINELMNILNKEENKDE